ncbi:hypothetical protein F4604DRAFT_1774288 [Suillus subluteus]|nr:hypothetical protein F4604DRAFT_1774288 [Suillus subluteus]
MAWWTLLELRMSPLTSQLVPPARLQPITLTFDFLIRTFRIVAMHIILVTPPRRSTRRATRFRMFFVLSMTEQSPH